MEAGVVTMETLLRRSSDIIHAPVSPDESVMVSIDAGRYYGLNAVGSRIWELLETPKSVAELCRNLVEEFEIDAPTCEVAVRNFVGDLIGSGIVH